ncbi:MAG: S8 family serine peptidase [Candidatus Kapabacteria bacterium]|nr:S8 family serine peptidase [Candidatus Kapabacteria bacterium]
MRIFNSATIASAIFFATVFPGMNCNAEYFEHKIISEKYKEHDVSILDKVVWVQFAPTVEDAVLGEIIAPAGDELNLTPLLPQKRQGEILAKRANGKVSEAEDKVLRTYILEYDEDISPVEYIAKLRREHPEIIAAEPYYTDKLLGSSVEPDDPYLDEQIALQKMQVREAWLAGLVGSPEITIGISDSGVQVSHEDLVENLAYNTGEIPDNGLDDDNNGYIDDYAGYNFSYLDDGVGAGNVAHSNAHGTQVAGIAAARANNAIGVAGTGNQCRFYPLKVCPKNSSKVLFGYQSIIYAAVNHFKVLNCSWGNVKPFSQIEQDIIDYAVEQGVSIVASSGNISSGGVDMFSIFYPAGYDGVLGVGETTGYDYVDFDATLSLQTDIMAPNGIYYTCLASSDNASYERVSGGSSYSSPAVAGLVGLVRAKYPELSAREALEFSRLCADDISASNTSDKQFFLPGRVNFTKALELTPLGQPAIRPLDVSFTDADGNPISRFNLQDNIKINISAYNYLGKGENLSFRLSQSSNNGNDFATINNAEVALGAVAEKSPLAINGFSFSIKDKTLLTTPEFTVFRVDVLENGRVIDFFTFPINCYNDVSTFSNNALTFSVSDYGRFGSSVNSLIGAGQGFTPKTSYNQLYTASGLCLSVNEGYLYTGFMSDQQFKTSFASVKPFTGADAMTGTMAAKYLVDNTISVTTKYSFPSADLPLVRVDFTVNHDCEIPLPGIALGMYFDWDLTPYIRENTTGYFAEAIPDEAPATSTAAQFAANYNSSSVVGTLVFSDTPNAIAQCAGTTGADYDAALMVLMNGGISEQYDGKSDIASFAGMKFHGETEPNTPKKFTMLVGYGESKSALAGMLQNAYRTLSVNETATADAAIFPSPAADYIEFENTNPLSGEIEIFAISGRKALVGAVSISDVTCRINVAELAPGGYFVFSGGKYVGKFIKAGR